MRNKRIVYGILAVLLAGLWSCASVELSREQVECDVSVPFSTLDGILDERLGSEPLHLFVSPDGMTGASGSEHDPFRSPEEARDHIRILKKDGLFPEGGVVVNLREGGYRLNRSFILGPEDSGMPGAPVVYRGYGSKEVVFSGGILLDLSRFSPVSDPSVMARLSPEAAPHIRQVDLRDEGVTDFGEIDKRGFGWPRSSVEPELFFGGRSMIPARYPDNGFIHMEAVQDQGFIPRTYEGDDMGPADFLRQKGPVLVYPREIEEREDLWALEEEIWLTGYWRWEWADDSLKVLSIDREENRFTAAHPSYYGVGDEPIFYARNLLCELDSPGEWYLSREKGILYFYPPEEPAVSEIALSLLSEPLIRLDGASNIVIGNIRFSHSRGSAVVMMNGENNLIAACEFSFLGGKAVEIGDEENAFKGTLLLDSESGGGRNNGVVNSVIRHTGSGGISILGGDRASLTPAGNYAANNHICDFSRVNRTYSPAVSLSGVGNSAVSNEIHDGPHMAINFQGNDLLIEGNEIYDVAYETSDVGVIYSCRDWTYRGNVIRGNYIHHISTVGGEGSYAVYLDDMMSSAEIRDNLFYKIDNYAFLVGGGRDNLIENNVLVDCRNSMIIDARATNWAAATATAPDGTCYVALLNTPWQSEIWRSRYPELTNILKDDPAYPKGNVVRNNFFYNSGELRIHELAREFGVVEGNIRKRESDLKAIAEAHTFIDFSRFGTDF